MAAKKDKDNRSVEETFELIEQKIERLEDDEVPLEEAFLQFREGMALVKKLEGAIDKIEKQVMQITEEGEEEPFE
ncbi:MAG: exodeoxyribonuclease VII small subunit [Lachnospiraceae bacterium]|nr:exodeoxyribonuclease VII small subunit [Lachnospiraceae bacterium]